MQIRNPRVYISRYSDGPQVYRYGTRVSSDRSKLEPNGSQFALSTDEMTIWLNKRESTWSHLGLVCDYI